MKYSIIILRDIDSIKKRNPISFVSPGLRMRITKAFKAQGYTDEEIKEELIHHGNAQKTSKLTELYKKLKNES